MGENEEIQLIEAYLASSLSEPERERFEEALARSVLLREKLALYKMINDTATHAIEGSGNESKERYKKLASYINSGESDTLRATISSVGNEYHQKKNTSGSGRLWYIAAALAILFSVVFVFLQDNSSSQELYAQYFDAKDLPGVVQRGDEVSTFLDGVNAFGREDFVAALQYFNQYEQAIVDLPVSFYLYKGVALSKQGRFNEAIDYINRFITLETIDTPKGYWFKSLIYLQMDDLDQAKKTLVELQNLQTSYKSTEVLKLIELLE